MLVGKPRQALMRRHKDVESPLGFRFDLARKLVQSVSFLHASGWFHKNIRTAELIFFPKDNKTISRGRGGINLDKPFSDIGFPGPTTYKNKTVNRAKGTVPLVRWSDLTPPTSSHSNPPLLPNTKPLPHKQRSHSRSAYSGPAALFLPAKNTRSPRKSSDSMKPATTNRTITTATRQTLTNQRVQSAYERNHTNDTIPNLTCGITHQKLLGPTDATATPLVYTHLV